MHHRIPLVSILTLISGLSVLGQGLPNATETLTWSGYYTDSDNPFEYVACSGFFATQNITAFSQLPTYPHVGGTFTVDSWDSSACGETYVVQYEGNEQSFVVVDSVASGFVVSLQVMDELTSGQAEQLGTVSVTWLQAY